MLILSQTNVINLNILSQKSIIGCTLNNFIFLLKSQSVEEAIEKYIKEEVEIEFNHKNRIIPKHIWIKYLRKSILSSSTNVLQFKVDHIRSNYDKSSFKIYMICRSLNGLLSFSEISINNYWYQGSIYKLNYSIKSH